MKSHLKEKFLLFRLRAKKDADAFGQIYDIYVKQIYRFIYFKVRSTEQAEDLTSETFLKAWQYLKEKDSVSHLQALLYSVARSVVIDHYRKNATIHEVALELEDGSERPEAATESLQIEMEHKVDASLVLEKLHHLKEEYRDAIVMRYLDGLSTGEIAEALGKSSVAVRVLLHRATKALTDIITNDSKRTEKLTPDSQQ